MKWLVEVMHYFRSTWRRDDETGELYLRCRVCKGRCRFWDVIRT